MNNIIRLLNAIASQGAIFLKAINMAYIAVSIPVLFSWKKVKGPVLWTAGITLMTIVIFGGAFAITFLLKIQSLAAGLAMICALTALLIGMFGSKIGRAVAEASRYGQKDAPKTLVAKATRTGLELVEVIGKEIEGLFKPLLVLAVIMAFVSVLISVIGFHPYLISNWSILIYSALYLIVIGIVQGGDIRKVYKAMNVAVVVILAIFFGNLIRLEIVKSWTNSKSEIVSSVNQEAKKISKKFKFRGSNSTREASRLETAASATFGVILPDSIANLKTGTFPAPTNTAIADFKIKRWNRDTVVNWLARGDEVLVKSMDDSLKIDGMQYYLIKLPDATYGEYADGQEYYILAKHIQLTDGLGQSSGTISSTSMSFGTNNIQGDYSNPIHLYCSNSISGSSYYLDPKESYKLHNDYKIVVKERFKSFHFRLEDGTMFSSSQVSESGFNFNELRGKPFKIVGVDKKVRVIVT